MHGYRITPEAKEDLRGIAAYTLQTWGELQHSHYRARFAECFERIALGQMVPRRFSKTYPDLCVVHCQHHYVFYLEVNRDSHAIILAVFHEKMDCLTRLKKRLE